MALPALTAAGWKMATCFPALFKFSKTEKVTETQQKHACGSFRKNYHSGEVLEAFTFISDTVLEDMLLGCDDAVRLNLSTFR